MAAAEARPPLSVRSARTIAAPREKVFRAWTEPAAIRRWFVEESEGRFTEEPQLDVRPGGAYRFTGESGGKPWSIHGTYKEVRPPERLVFTWLWEGHPEPDGSGDTLVTVEFHDRGGSTEVVVIHENFTSEAAREDHARGWEGCLAAMARFMEEW
jgi:uncharacterized protein YndB with AHSA1/START domain